MAFKVSEIYGVDVEHLDTLKEALKNSLYLFEQVPYIEDVEILEDIDGTKVIANSTWNSRESFDTYLKSEQLMALLQSKEAAIIKKVATSFEMKMYNVL